ncbi:hypothetical protein EON83_19770 [bacterium]|nr:MAG: hypothetical protein EON83_19770 [bacterium]
MKTPSPREIALVCAPLLIVGVAGFLLSRRPPAPDEGKLRLVFNIAKPTVLEAFDGSDAALVVELKGPNTETGPNNNPLRIYESAPFLELRTSKGVQSSRWRQASGIWSNVWKKSVNGNRFLINSRPIPAGKLRFGIDTIISPLSSSPTKTAPHISGNWTVNRALIKPFNFGKMARIPLVRLTSVKIIQVNGTRNIRGEAVFDYIGTGINAETPFDCDFHERNGGMGWGSGSGDLTPQNATRRVREWTVYNPFTNAPSHRELVYISGRVSADERWPLAFEFESFDFLTAKVGQTIKFKSWPAALPKL